MTEERSIWQLTVEIFDLDSEDGPDIQTLGIFSSYDRAKDKMHVICNGVSQDYQNLDYEVSEIAQLKDGLSFSVKFRSKVKYNGHVFNANRYFTISFYFTQFVLDEINENAMKMFEEVC